LVAAVERMESGQITFRESFLRARAAEFGRQAFQSRLMARVRQAWLDAGKPEASLPGSVPYQPFEEPERSVSYA
jgi:hypothetical protein